MKLSVVISLKNRIKFLERTLKTLRKQTMPRNKFELIFVDDNSTDNIRGMLDSYVLDMNAQYIRIDSSRNDFPIFWGPSISNNVGFKAARGEVIMITGPEILHQKNNFDFGYESAMKDTIAFGHVFHSNYQFIQMLEQNPYMTELSFEELFRYPFAKVMDITINTYYWFICTVKKEHIMRINGCDEEYMRGICGDDDDFVNRIEALGIPRIHDFRMNGIHQDHSVDDIKDRQRIRRSAIWEEARKINTQYLEDWYTKRNRTPLANINRDWGSDRVILHKEIISSI